MVVRLVEAQYEDGVFRPTERLSLRSGERVNLIVVRRPDPGRWDLARLSKTGGEDALYEEGLAEWASALEDAALQVKIRDLDESELEELELPTDEALGRVEPK